MGAVLWEQEEGRDEVEGGAESIDHAGMVG